MRVLKIANYLQPFGYHGTTAEAGKLIEKDGFVRPRGLSEGNWTGGFFGGNPSNPDLVYVALDRNRAEDIAVEVCRKNSTKDASLVIAALDWTKAVPDEDVIFEVVTESPRSPVVMMGWEILAKSEGISVEDAMNLLHDDPEMEPLSDAQVAEYMKTVASEINPRLTEQQRKDLMGYVAAFSVPLKVQKVTFFSL